MEYYTINLNLLYTKIDVVWFICMAITPILPYAPFVAIVHFGMIYWIKKYYILRECTIQNNVDDKILKKSLNGLLFSQPYFILGLYHYDLQFKISVTTDYTKEIDSYEILFDLYLLWLIVSIILTWVPAKFIWRKLLSRRKSGTVKMYFSKSKLLRSYNYYNPNYLEEEEVKKIRTMINNSQ